MSVVEAKSASLGIAIVDPTKYKGHVAAAAIAGYAFDGVDIMVLALALPMILKDWHISMLQGGSIVTAMLMGTCLGGYIFGPIGDKHGRKKALIWCITFFAVTTGLCGFAQNYIQLAVLRFISGLGLGAEWALGATLMAEFFPAEQRGKANSWMQMGWPIGYAIALGFQAWLVPIYGWRALFFAGTSAIVVALYIWLFVPESPLWIKSQENKGQGKAAQVQSQAAAPKMTDLFKGDNMRAFVLASIVCTCALMAYWAVNTWLPTILAKERGLNLKAMTGYLLGLQVASVVGYLIGGVAADKIGKRLLIAISAFGAAVTWYLWLGIQVDATAFFWLGMIHYVVASAFWASLASFLAEQYPTYIRALGVSSSYSTGRLFSLLVPMVLGAVAMKTGLLGAITFGAIFYIIAMAATFMLKETRGLQL